MKGIKFVQWAIGVGLILPFLVGCSAPPASTPVPAASSPADTTRPKPGLTTTFLTATPVPATSSPTSTASPTPALTATPLDRIGVPVSRGAWQVSIEGAREERFIQGYGLDFAPKEGYAFLVVDILARSLDPAQMPCLSAVEFAAVDINNQAYPLLGGALGFERLETIEEMQAQGVGMCSDSLAFVSSAAYLVFVVGYDLIDKPWKLGFGDVLSPSFSVGHKPGYQLATKVSVEPGSLPSWCDWEKVTPLADTGWLAYERWENGGLVMGSMLPDGSLTKQTCRGIAFGDFQFAPDGAALLLTGPLQGWPSLSVIEPDGAVTALVANGKKIRAEFDSSGDYVLFTVGGLGEDSQTLYVFDRKENTVTQLLQCWEVIFDLLTNGRLLVEVAQDYEHSGTSDRQYYLGRTDGSQLELLTLPAGLYYNEAYDLPVTEDGEHVVFTEVEYPIRRLVIARLDNTEEREIDKGEFDNASGELSPDGRFVLYGVLQRESGIYEVRLFNLVTNTGVDVVSDVDGVEWSFSPDSRWGLVFVYVDGEPALHIIDTARGKVIWTIPGVTRAYFSPDGSMLAYSVTNWEEMAQIYVMTLADGNVNPLGSGTLKGWYP